MRLLIASTFVVQTVLLLAYCHARRSARDGPRWWLHEILLGWQTLYWLGALVLLATMPSEATTRFVAIACVAHLSFTVGCVVASARPARIGDEAPHLTPGEVRAATTVALVSAAVCAAFVASVLRNEDLGLILAGVLTGDESFTSYRVVMSSGSAAYLAPGYVKQFRDVLLLGSLVALALRTPAPRWVLIAALGMVGFVAALLSGARGVLLIYMYTFGLVALLRSGSSINARRFVVATTAVTAVAAFVAASFLLDRTTAGASFLQVVGESVWGLFDRLALTVPRENAAGFPMWSAIAPTWGQSWASDLSGILPGVQVSLSSELHELLGGSALGNSPLGMSSDLYLDWGMMGVALIPFLYAFLLSGADRILLASSSPLARVVRLTAIPLTFSWYSPFLFALNGGVIVIVAAFLANVLRRRG